MNSIFLTSGRNYTFPTLKLNIFWDQTRLPSLTIILREFFACSCISLSALQTPFGRTSQVLCKQSGSSKTKK